MDIPAYFESHGIRILRRGHLLVCCCPFHNERTPSFYIFPDGHGWCFGGCDEKQSYFRDVIDAIWRLEFPGDATRKRAFARARELGVPTETFAPRPVQQPERVVPTPEEMTAMDIAFAVYREMFERRVGFPARRWLSETRGLHGPLLDLALQTVGFAPEGGQYHIELVTRLQEVLGDQWLSTAMSCGLVTVYGRQRMRNRVFFGVRDGEHIVTYQGRTILPDEVIRDTGIQKHLNAPRFRKLPYEPIPREAALYPGTYIDEGPMDGLAHGANGFYVQVLLGSKIPSVQTLKSLPHPIIGCLDNEAPDAAGPRGQLMLRLVCRDNGIPFIDGTVSQGKDPSEYLNLVGPDDFVKGHYWIMALAA